MTSKQSVLFINFAGEPLCGWNLSSYDDKWATGAEQPTDLKLPIVDGGMLYILSFLLLVTQLA